MVASGDKNPIIDYARGTQIENALIEQEETGDLLERQAMMFGAAKRRMDGSEMRVICSSESRDERIKLVVVEHSFSDVIRAMYNND